MGPATTLHMLLGAIIGWGILSPLAKSKGWAPGPVEDWSSGSKGWIVWISLASKSYFRSVFALFRLFFGSQDVLREQSTPKTDRTTRSTS